METNNYDLSRKLAKLEHLHTIWKNLDEIRTDYISYLNKESEQKLIDLITYIILKHDNAKKELLEQIKVNGKNFEL